MKKKLFVFWIVLLFLSGCSKKEENSFNDLGPDDYFVCSYEASYQTEKASSDCEAVLLNHDGKVIAEFPGGYVSGIITKDGYMTGKKNYQITEFCHRFLADYIKEGSCCIDATCGKGNDMEFLCRMAGESGKVYAFDIQEQAVEYTSDRLEVTTFTM